MALSGNKGEWSELYAFFKILTEGRIYTANADYERVGNVFLSVLSVIREEIKGFVYRYGRSGSEVVIKLNGTEVKRVPNEKFIEQTKRIWKLVNSAKDKRGTLSDSVIDTFLGEVFIKALKSPAKKTSDYFGGTIDIMLETQDKSGVIRNMGFSCKSDLSSPATLFNASSDATNFSYRLEGNMTDELMARFNGLCDRRGNISAVDRMTMLKENGVEPIFVGCVKPLARVNLIKSGGLEMPAIVGAMLKCFYYERVGRKTTVAETIEYLVKYDPARYGFDDLYNTYYTKVAKLLYDQFTGMRLGSEWSGRAEVNGGYIIVKKDGDVVAFHSTITDEFKDFLVSKLRMESPSHKRHKDMVIEKVGGDYFLKMGLQFRF